MIIGYETIRKLCILVYLKRNSETVYPKLCPTCSKCSDTSGFRLIISFCSLSNHMELEAIIFATGATQVHWGERSCDSAHRAPAGSLLWTGFLCSGAGIYQVLPKGEGSSMGRTGNVSPSSKGEEDPCAFWVLVCSFLSVWFLSVGGIWWTVQGAGLFWLVLPSMPPVTRIGISLCARAGSNPSPSLQSRLLSSSLGGKASTRVWEWVINKHKNSSLPIPPCTGTSASWEKMGCC